MLTLLGFMLAHEVNTLLTSSDKQIDEIGSCRLGFSGDHLPFGRSFKKAGSEFRCNSCQLRRWRVVVVLLGRTGQEWGGGHFGHSNSVGS